jgi:ubiquinol-cytochrome c reductase cytochrome b subunit
MTPQPVERAGVGTKVKSWFVEVGRSFFPSMGWDEWRQTLRGDPAPRPNPRMRVHSNSFWYHIRPRAVPEEATAWYYTLGMGWLSFYFFVLETITGIILMIYYIPSVHQAYDTMLQIMGDVPLGLLMRNLHRLGGHFMVGVVFVHMIRTYVTASYKAPRQFAWFTGVMLLLATLVLSFSGYLLPWDQLAYWAVTIGSSMADSAPLVGNATNMIVRGAPDIGQGTLIRFYLLHVLLLPVVALIVISIHYYAVRKQEISPIHELFEGKAPSKRKVPFLPDQVFFEIALIALLTFAFIVVNQYFWTAKLENHADPLVTPQHTKAPWYFLWLQGLLKMGDKFGFGVAYPLGIFIVMFLLPYLDRNPSRRFKDRKIALLGGVTLFILLAFQTYAGLPTYGITMTGSSELQFEWVPGEGEGKADHVPFDMLPEEQVVFDSAEADAAGNFDAGFVEGDGAALNQRARDLFFEFYSDVHHWQHVDRSFADGSATLTIEPWQYETTETGEERTSLKKVTLVLTTGGKEQAALFRFIPRTKDLSPSGHGWLHGSGGEH